MEELSLLANQVLAECHSTNDIARRLGVSGYPQGTWVSAERQTQGRGRNERTWISDRGNLHLSFLLRDVPKERWTWIPLVTGIRVSDFLRRAFPELQPSLKWPNDLIVRDRKLGGILCEGADEKSGPFVVVGIGLNVTSAPRGPEISAISLKEALGKEIELGNFRSDLIRELSENLHRDCLSSASDLKSAFFTHAYYSAGDQITWSDEVGRNEGMVEGLGDHGELLVKDSSGATKRLFAADLHLRVAKKA